MSLQIESQSRQLLNPGERDGITQGMTIYGGQGVGSTAKLRWKVDYSIDDQPQAGSDMISFTI